MEKKKIEFYNPAEEKTDYAFWMLKTPQERIAALEYLRNQYLTVSNRIRQRPKEFLQLLNQNKVEYLVVGGYAVAFHGYPRYTGDFDVLLYSPE
ncbi:MAG: hypothetical protein AVDCRST_MAG95-1094 [uncultured Adhaeribacter sp.]|uniref:Uncharacterized protein n=1 Tax=uncultured Adhaeribacter sp. TaxID=448109 RepID=A0A6J4HUW4_9BACT|nr:MAG: hypothetical protein AVDCRST_MAG95-1094 [uncultured Adhaeribacter sp.]